MNMHEVNYKVIGLMSGTSLDGVDLCYAHFVHKNKKWSYQIIACQTIEYPNELTEKLLITTHSSAEQLFILDKQLGVFFSEVINGFIEKHKIERNKIDAICSHGHTVFHQPDKQISVQIGCGATIARHTQLPTIANFRQKDVLYGGQGAPLVPIGDLMLFSNVADSFLNIGGFANFSTIKNNEITVASDICPVNNLINYYARQQGKHYDKNGEIAKNAIVSTTLLDKLNNLSIYKQETMPSLGWEWVEKIVIPIVDNFPVSIAEKIATITKHAITQIANRLNECHSKSILVTGGGALNTFLIDELKKSVTGNIICASQQLINFKEALVFGFLGVLFLENVPNCVHTVTGATKSVIGGVLYSF